MDYKELVSAFGKACGLDEINIDDNGFAMMQADDILLTFMEVSATRQIVMFADIAEKSEETRGRLYESLLQAQYLGDSTGGAVFAISPDGKIVLYRVDTLADLDVERFAKTVENFLNIVDMWRGFVATYDSSDMRDEKKESTPDMFLGGVSGFMQV